jgi:hypothetical protein
MTESILNRVETTSSMGYTHTSSSSLPQRVVTITGIVFFCVFCWQLLFVNKADVDMWGNTGFVRVPAWHREFIRDNHFSFTEPDRQWINHEWLSQYIFNSVYSRYGNLGLILLKCFLGACTIFLLYLACKKQSKTGILNFLFLLLVVSTMSYGFSFRPQLFTYLMTALLVMLLRFFSSLITKFPFLFFPFGIIWANLHGAFFIGAIVLLILSFGTFVESSQSSCKGKIVISHFIALISFIAGTFINPYGLKLWSFILHSAGYWRPYLSEWAPFHPLEHCTEHPDFIALVLLSIIALCFSGRQKSYRWIFIAGIALISAFLMRRNIPLFAIAVTAVIPEHIESIAGVYLRRFRDSLPPFITIPLLLACTCLSTWYASGRGKYYSLDIEVPRNQFPVDTVRFMQAHKIYGNMLIFFDWAHYCIWHFYPESRVFLDGRFCDAYSKQTIHDFFNFFYCGDKWENALQNYSTDIVLIHKGNPVYERMLQRHDWTLVCTDSISALFLNNFYHAEAIHKLQKYGLPYRIFFTDTVYFP